MPLARLFALVVAIVLAAATAASAAVEVPFAPRYSANVRGDVTIAANTLMTCPDAGGTNAQCIAAREGVGGNAALNNNGYAMERVDADGDAGTFDSSRATLSLPAGAEVQFAGLYYGARLSAGSGGTAAPDANARGALRLQVPGSGVYTTLAAEVDDSAEIAASYTGFADVTAAVAAAGPGEYSVADVQAGSGEDRYAGWALVVAYRDPSAQPRSIRVFDGLASIEQGDPSLEIPVAGLETPGTGAVNADVGVVAYEGDRGASGDRLALDGQFLSDAVNPVNNVFNSSIAAGGVNRGEKSPNYVNQLGFDANLIVADGVLGNGATSAVLAESTSLEQYLTQVVATSIELDPEALEPTVQPPPSAPGPTTTEEDQQKKPKAKQGGGGGSSLALEVKATDRAVPGAVVAYLVTVRPRQGAAHDVEVCNQLPRALHRLASPRASVRGDRACWHLGKLAAGTSRSFMTTARVEAGAGPTLATRTVLTAANAPTRRQVSRLSVSPLPDLPCLRPLRAVAGDSATATASC